MFRLSCAAVATRREGHRSPRSGWEGQHPAMGPEISWTVLFDFRTVAANISKLFRPLEKPPLAALPFFVGC
jgi:hypothetical protein